MKKILVTGGAGFVGSHMVDLLVEHGMEVLIVDNMSTGKKENVQQGKDIQLFHVDVTDANKLENVFSAHPDIDGVVHLAAQSKVGPSLEQPTEDANINIMGTINLLEQTRKQGVQSFVYASSAAVYGDTEKLPILEDDLCRPLSPYGVSKLAAEEYVQAYGRLYDMDVKVLRFANVYGPRQSAATEAGVITIFIEQMLSGERPIIFGDGKQTRDFVYVKDVAHAVLSCLVEKSATSKHAVYNVSTAQEISVEQLLQEMCAIVDTDFDPHYAEKRPGDIENSYLSYERLQADYEWEPQTLFKDGLVETIRYYKQNL